MSNGKKGRRAKRTQKKANVKVLSKKATKTKKVVEVVKDPIVFEITDMQRELYAESMMDLFNVQSYSGREHRMQKYVKDYIGLHHPYASIVDDEHGNIYVTKGDAESYPCIVAHLDTVHTIINNEDYFVRRDADVLYAMDRSNYSRAGIGGDDQVGIWIALNMLDLFPNVKLAFFVEEERGCIGSNKADFEWFNDCSFALEADRRGYGDFVNSISGVTMYSKKFASKIAPVLERWGREETWGGLTDVKALASNKVEICMANASCGYYRPHTDNEYVSISEVIMTLYLFRDIIETCYTDGRRWVFKRALTPTYRSYGNNNYYGYDLNTPRTTGANSQRTLGFEADEGTEWERVGNKWVLKKLADDDLEEPFSPDRYRTCDCGTTCQYDEHAQGYYCHECQIYDFKL